MDALVRPSQPGRVKEWWCCRCPTLLAWFDASGLHLHDRLTRLDGDHEGMPRYGWPVRRAANIDPRRGRVRSQNCRAAACPSA